MFREELGDLIGLRRPVPRQLSQFLMKFDPTTRRIDHNHLTRRIGDIQEPNYLVKGEFIRCLITLSKWGQILRIDIPKRAPAQLNAP